MSWQTNLLSLLAIFAYAGAAMTSGTPPKISNVVVLMLENRAFDHVLGWLPHEGVDVDGLTGNETNPLNTSDPKSPRYRVASNAPDFDMDPGHSISATESQMFGTRPTTLPLPFPAPMDGFAESAETKGKGLAPLAMLTYNSTSVPVLTTLGKEFAIFDRYYSSVPGPTEVNRMYIHSCTSHGAGFNDKKLLAEGYPQTTVYDKLNENGKSWNIFFEDFPTALFLRRTREPHNLKNFRLMEDFYKRAAEGSLPEYSFLDPRYFWAKGPIVERLASDQHPSHDMAEGERLIKKIYDSLRASPKWNETLLMITYDEHGGFYDHVPPRRGVPNPEGLNSTSPVFDFTNLGVRIPVVMASPWIKKGTVMHEPEHGFYDHSSVYTTLRDLFGIDGNHTLTNRDAASASFADVLNADEPRTDCPHEMPEPPKTLLPPAHNRRRGRFGQVAAHLDVMNDLQESFVWTAAGLFDEEPPANSLTEADAGVYVTSRVFKLLGWKNAADDQA